MAWGRIDDTASDTTGDGFVDSLNNSDDGQPREFSDLEDQSDFQDYSSSYDDTGRASYHHGPNRREGLNAYNNRQSAAQSMRLAERKAVSGGSGGSNGGVLAGEKSGGLDVGARERASGGSANGGWDYNGGAGSGGKSSSKGGKDSKQSGNFASRHKKGITGWIIGLVMGGGIFGIGTLVSGPMQFLQIGALLQDWYTYAHDNISAVRYAANLKSKLLGSSADDLSDRVQNSRLGQIGRRLRNSQIRSLQNKGINFGYNSANNANALSVNIKNNNGLTSYSGNDNVKIPTDVNSDSYKRMTNNIANGLDINPKYIKSIDEAGNAILDFNKMGYGEAKKLLNKMNGTGKFNIIGKMKTRSTLKAAGKVSWLHPIKKLKLKISNKLAAKFSAFLVNYAAKVINSGKGIASSLLEKGVKDALNKQISEQVEKDLAGKTQEEINEEIGKRVAEASEKLNKEIAEYAAKNATEEGVEGVVKKGVSEATEKLLKEGAEQALNQVIKKLNVAGWIITLIEVMCMITAAENNVGSIKYQQIVAVAEGEAAAHLATASEIKAGFENYDSETDPDSEEGADAEIIEPMDQLGLLSKQKLYNDEIAVIEDETDNDGKVSGFNVIGTTTSSWWNSAPVKHNLGETVTDEAKVNVNPVLNDVSKEGLNFGGNDTMSGIFSALSNGIETAVNKSTILGNAITIVTGGQYTLLGLACDVLSVIDKILGDILSLILKPLGGLLVGLLSKIPVLSKVGNGIMSAIVKGMSVLNDWLKGKPLTIDASTLPEDYANIANYGAVFMNNDNMRNFAGRQLSGQESAVLWQDQQRFLAEEYAKKSIIAKIFDPTDYRSTVNVIARTADFNIASQDPVTQLGNVVKFFGALPKLFGVAINKIGGVSAASSSEPYNFGVPIYGYSDTEMNSMMGNTYDAADNIDKVFDIAKNHADWFNKDNGKIKRCWGVTVDPDTLEVNILDNSEGKTWNYVDNSNKEDNNDCNDTNEDWYRVRLYILDYGLMSAGDCYWTTDSSSSESCATTGF
ncbi:MAG: hypothetical protein LBM09_02110 [Candidatus Nomurabacteria bacterium]|jgi:hypothetical protein|nr:hypothetical protein [Candidatus Nomurabacteria bacterium]